MNFTYENFENDGTFTLFDPLFTLILIFSALFVIIVLRFAINPKIMLFIGVFVILLTAQLYFISGIISDELSLNGAAKDLYMTIAIAGLQVVCILYAFVKSKKK